MVKRPTRMRKTRALLPAMNLSLMHIIRLQKVWTQLWDDDDGGGDEQLWGVFFLSP